jgi:hypothetical protein
MLVKKDKSGTFKNSGGFLLFWFMMGISRRNMSCFDSYYLAQLFPLYDNEKHSDLLFEYICITTKNISRTRAEIILQNDTACMIHLLDV